MSEEINASESDADSSEAFIKKHFVEIFLILWNQILFHIELNRDASHGDNMGTVVQGSNFGEHQFGSVPLETKGISGFFDQHMGNAVETLILFYGWRVVTALASVLIEKLSNKKINVKVKVGISLVMALLTTNYLEINYSNGDISDFFGPMLAVVWVTGGYKALDLIYNKFVQKNNTHVTESETADRQDSKRNKIFKKMRKAFFKEKH